MNRILAFITLFALLLPSAVFAVTTSPFTSDGNTYTLHLMDGTVGSATKIDNAEGTAARDLVETGAVTATTGQTTPTTDGAYNGFGASKYLKVANANLGTWPTGAQTYEMWLNPTSCAGGSGLSFILSKQSSSAGTYIGIDSSCHVIGRFSSGGTTKDYTSTGTISTGVWTYVMVAFNPSTSIRLCFNGAQDSNITSGIPASARATTDDLNIATQQNVRTDASFSWTGSIDAIKISNVTKTCTDADAYYNPVASTQFYTTAPWFYFFW